MSKVTNINKAKTVDEEAMMKDLDALLSLPPDAYVDMQKLADDWPTPLLPFYFCKHVVASLFTVAEYCKGDLTEEYVVMEGMSVAADYLKQMCEETLAAKARDKE